jgi:hypothetical protein
MKIKSILKIIALLFIFTYFSGCASILSLQERENTLQTIIDTNGYEFETISTTAFNLLAVKEKKLEQCIHHPLNIYIEGDGLSWVNKSVVSQNPTPLNPLGLKLMSIDNTPCKIYLARPCQTLSVYHFKWLYEIILDKPSV